MTLVFFGPEKLIRIISSATSPAFEFQPGFRLPANLLTVDLVICVRQFLKRVSYIHIHIYTYTCTHTIGTVSLENPKVILGWVVLMDRVVLGRFGVIICVLTLEHREAHT